MKRGVQVTRDSTRPSDANPILGGSNAPIGQKRGKKSNPGIGVGEQVPTIHQRSLDFGYPVILSKLKDPIMKRYFVMQLTDRDLKDRGRPIGEKRFEIQVLDGEGRATACGYVGIEDVALDVGGREIPRAVIEAARSQPLGQGNYVDEHGRSVPFF